MWTAVVLVGAALLWQWSAPLYGPWRFHTGDNPQWAAPAFDDSSWTTLDLTAPETANDGDQGITHYASGWSARGFDGYSGFAWYRIRVTPLPGDNALAILGPAMVDNAYLIYVNGKPLGGLGDFSKATPIVYGIHPMRFAFTADSTKPITVAVRVWMAPWAAGPSSGGMHVAPVIGNSAGASAAYSLQWFEKIRAFALEIVQTLLFISLAIAAFSLFAFDLKDDGLAYLGVALLLTALWRANLAFYWLSSRESITAFVYGNLVLLVPITLCAWTLAWYHLLRVRSQTWITPATFVLTGVYIVAEFLKRPLFNGGFSAPVAPLAATASRFDRYVFLALLAFIVYCGFRERNRETWIALPSIVLISVGQFASELLALGVPGIWFPFGMGVSLANWAYLLSTFTITALLWTRRPRVERVSDFAASGDTVFG